ncbi:MAG: bifunctional glutamate N-acetyltransferase/amino-acid acetyltransferase ArgJ, partial [Pseudomonadota bacterium]
DLNELGGPFPVAHDLMREIAQNGAQCGAAEAIMTTDTFPKGASATARVGERQVRVAGIAKGSGMIAPDMATMLAFVFTDADIAPDALQTLLAEEAETSFNAITVDSDTSTSDTLLLAATGASGAPRITQAEEAGTVRTALRAVLRDLAHQIVRDGEGATKFVEITVEGGVSDASAKRIALAIANSPLVKTAVAGEDPNWGRIVMAIGKAGEPADRDLISIRFGTLPVAENGWVSPSYEEEKAVAYMQQDQIHITIGLGVGEGRATVWTCDLTHGYISINADYRS